MNDLFQQTASDSKPLAARMRPRNLDEFVGQAHILGPGRLLRRAILADQLTSVIFAGPPGCGKTTLAHVIAQTTKSAFFSLNAVLAGLADLRDVMAKAQEFRDLYARKTILFVDEVHRWNKAQQDALLPWTENGTIVLIGATTENPYFKVNRALVSRSHIFQLTALTDEDLFTAAHMALQDKERGYGRYDIDISDEALAHLVHFAAGDCRALLNALELAVETTPKSFPPAEGEKIAIDLSIAEDSIQRKALPYDPSGDDHYDTISAFIKSVRGSDPDAALYWLAQMLHRGEDVDFIWRRLLILASEDIGLADTQALTVVNNCIASFERIGLPEGYYPLAHATLYLSTCAKTNSVMGFFDALKEVESGSRGDVPNHLRDTNRDAAGFGHGQGYKYPHSYHDHWVAQQYLPLTLKGKIFYHPTEEGDEKEIKKRVLQRREVQLTQSMQDFIPENYIALSPWEEKQWDAWWQHTSKRTAQALTWWRRSSQYMTQALTQLREKLFSAMALPAHSCVCVYGDVAGYVVLEALRRFKSGRVYVLLNEDQDVEALRFLTQDLDSLHQPQIHIAPTYEYIPDSPAVYEAVILYRPQEDPQQILPLVYAQLGSHSLLALILPAQTASLAQVFASILDNKQKSLLKKAEDQLNQSLLNETWKNQLENDHFHVQNITVSVEEEMRIPEEQIKRWFSAEAPLGKVLHTIAAANEIATIEKKLRQYQGPVVWPRQYCLLISHRRK